VWEEVWRSKQPEPKQLLQGLIQVAVAMVHFRDRGRPAVARRVLAKGRRRIEPYRPSALGLDLEELLGRVESWSLWLEHRIGVAPQTLRLSVSRPAELR
jgi:predicted metal-dependent hydrolase